MIIGTLSCKAILPIIFSTIVVNVVVSALAVGIISYVAWKVSKNGK